MSTKQLFVTALLCLTTVFSCKKDSGATTYPVAGLYTGTYTADSAPAQGSLFYSFVLYADGTMSTKGKIGDGSDSYGAGTYTLSGSTFVGTINTFPKTAGGESITQTINATYSNSGTLTNGSWKDKYNAGKFSTMQRVN